MPYLTSSCFLSVCVPFSVPSPEQKTLSDYVEGVLQLSLEDGRGQPQRRLARKNLSPNLLRRRIEELKEGEKDR